MPKLKPCPFCGGEASIIEVYHEERRAYKWYAHGLCKTCQASAGGTGFSETREEAGEKALAAWNRRTPEPEPDWDEVMSDPAVRAVVTGEFEIPFPERTPD